MSFLTTINLYDNLKWRYSNESNPKEALKGGVENEAGVETFQSSTVQRIKLWSHESLEVMEGAVEESYDYSA